MIPDSCHQGMTSYHHPHEPEISRVTRKQNLWLPFWQVSPSKWEVYEFYTRVGDNKIWKFTQSYNKYIHIIATCFSFGLAVSVARWLRSFKFLYECKSIWKRTMVIKFNAWMRLDISLKLCIQCNNLIKSKIWWSCILSILIENSWYFNFVFGHFVKLIIICANAHWFWIIFSLVQNIKIHMHCNVH